MKKLLTILLGLFLLAFCFGLSSGLAIAKKGKFAECAKITEGAIYYSPTHYLAGQPIKPGFDEFGYNYQAHLFIGYYCNAYLGGYGYPPYEGDDESYYQRLVDEGYAGSIATAETLMSGVWCWPHRDIILNMKWNDAWLSNKDCDEDEKLDRHYGYESYIGSGAWETNHMFGTYINEDGEECHWNYFVKIVAVPADAYLDGGIWYAADGTEIGPEIWGSFAVIQEISNDPCAGEHGAIYVSPAGPGFGKWK